MEGYLMKSIFFAVALTYTAFSCSTMQPSKTNSTGLSSNTSSSNDTGKPNPHIVQGNQFAKDGLLREAVDSYKKAIAKEPNNLTAYRNLGIVLVKAGDTANAIINLEKSLADFEDNFEANFYLGEAYRSEEKLSEAIFRYKKSLKIHEDEPKALKSLAWSYYKIRFYSEAIKLAQRLQKITPNDEQSVMILARVQMKLKRDADALAILRKGMEKADPQTHPYFLSVIGEIQASQGKTNDALATWKQALSSQPLLASALMGTGKIILEQGNPKDAVEYLERAVRLKPKMYEGYYWLARSLETSNPERALRNYNVFRKNSANDPDLVELFQDTKKRTATLSTRAKMDSN
jgi:tetratricopeptide (TPR) repeat protein